jgi:hypothetical protein
MMDIESETDIADLVRLLRYMPKSHESAAADIIENLQQELATLRQYKAEAESQEPAKWERLDKNFSTEDSDVAAKWEEKQLPVRKLYVRPVPAGSCAAPDGYVLVPIEPTKEMCDAYCENSIAPIGNLSRYGYTAMLSDIPSNSEGE